jgi:hypothetical protein
MIGGNKAQHWDTKSVTIDKQAAPSRWPIEIERVDLDEGMRFERIRVDTIRVERAVEALRRPRSTS